MSWPLVKLKDCCEVVGGATPKREIPEYWDSPDVPWVTPKDVSDLACPILEDAPEYISAAGFRSCSTSMVPKGSVLVTSRAPIGNIAIAGRDLCTNQGFKSLVPSASVDGLYLYYCMKHSSGRLQALGNGATFKEVSKKIVEEFEIPLPPLPDQKRIAAILDKADAIRRKRQQAIQLADDFLRAVFLDMFGDVVTSSGYESSERYKISGLVDYIDYRGKTPEKSETGIPLITAKNVRNGYVDEDPREYIPEQNYDAWMTRGFPRKNDVLFTTEAPLGNVALLGDYEKVAIGQRLIALRSKGKVTHEYLMFLLLHPFVQDLIFARSSGSTVKGIRTKELYDIELPVPGMQKQKEFSSIYWKAKSLTSNQESAHQLEMLNFCALSQKAFSGQL
ncbi:restriction endonuclease subunit S [Pseudomonas sp. V98_8]|uniref:restriction endonuclease subunit S n=1 Tax=Pseudomonas sp. V98_8 TaxID=3044228 RepID=UPI00249DD1C7|nr:restriction endonuclease subunit S [Pseudomonas sp. V98_8]MDI3390975.1 restriction endonuclease subunit S [Pseudomonas sp. V98_8]